MTRDAHWYTTTRTNTHPVLDLFDFETKKLAQKFLHTLGDKHLIIFKMILPWKLFYQNLNSLLVKRKIMTIPKCPNTCPLNSRKRLPVR